MGGVLGALGRRADDTYAALEPAGREIARQAFLRLVARGESGEPAARRVARTELRALSDEARLVDDVIDEFGRRRLLSFDRDTTTGEPTVQVAHEAILTRWPRLVGWIEEAREDLWTRRRLADAATDWAQAGRDPGFLLSASRLDLYASWAAATDLRLDHPERELLDASLAERRRLDEAADARIMRERALERRAATRLRALVAVLAVAALVATSLTVAVYGQGEAAREQGAIAAARELAAASIGNLGTDPQLSLLLAWQAADATSDRGFVVEEAMDAMHWALQASHVAYPASAARVVVRPGPGGRRGVLLLEPDQLMKLAATAAGRDLLPEECRTYLHRQECPEPPTVAGSAVTDVYTVSGVVPVERLASGSLAGTRVDIAAQLPVDLTPFLEPLERDAGIDVTVATGHDADLEARIAAADLPDIAIVERPALLAELARAGLLVDMSGFVDVARLRSNGGDYLVRLGTVGVDGTWPATDGHLYGAPFATEAESLVWYPRAAFERARYAVPGTWDELQVLTSTMVADGAAPWCLGVEAGTESGASAVALIEEMVLRAGGPDAYDGWAAGQRPFIEDPTRGAFQELGNLAFRDGYVLNGAAAALRTPEELAAWPMFVDPPGCWLHLAGGTARLTWPAGGSATLAAFPFPAADPRHADEVRGRAFSLVIFHDRPEVRRLVEALLGDQVAAAATSSFAGAGIWLAARADPAVGLDEVQGRESELLRAALRAGTFHVAASDLMPTRLAAAFAQGTVTYLTWGQVSLSGVLGDIEEVRRATN